MLEVFITFNTHTIFKDIIDILNLLSTSTFNSICFIITIERSYATIRAKIYETLKNPCFGILTTILIVGV